MSIWYAFHTDWGKKKIDNDAKQHNNANTFFLCVTSMLDIEYVRSSKNLRMYHQYKDLIENSQKPSK